MEGQIFTIDIRNDQTHLEQLEIQLELYQGRIRQWIQTAKISEQEIARLIDIDGKTELLEKADCKEPVARYKKLRESLLSATGITLESLRAFIEVQYKQIIADILVREKFVTRALVLQALVKENQTPIVHTVLNSAFRTISDYALTGGENITSQQLRITSQ